MSKADQLGAGRFGGGVRPVSARRQAVAAATGVPTEGVAAPTELPVHRISLNPDNPRSTLGDLTDLAGSLKTHGQKQAITVMNRDAYVDANPGQEAALEPDTTHVVVDGSSRLAAAREAGLATIKVMVSDDQGATSEELLESALVANIHRQDLEEIDEARALQRLLVIHGSQRALAKRLHRSQGWVSQRLALLHLTPELQARIGEEPIDLLRAVGNKPAEQQEAVLEALKAERARKEDEGTRTATAQHEQTTNGLVDSAKAGPVGEQGGDTAEDGPAGDYDVITSSPGTPATTGDSAAPTTSEAIPEPRAHASTPGTTETVDEEPRLRRVPYDEPGSLAMLLDAKIASDDTFFDLLRFLSTRALERDPARLGEVARFFVEQAAARVG
ncbi:plasmid partitioning protein [Streptomyces cellostaticus]|uniref:Plasmid partitioning protein n=1 Tax=Streptomyces cellostaticus TaxID=67285 RepID=A0A124HAB9_9ACTN|nr:ParB/RepB/Spo0J family partition protein [Streptomyces cellostaticus]KUM87636.1 plasmid partitioning protein [Streptomyces cellostaticus]GHI10339.1 plasmid partitioning protein [Streptomyces cellostaticus]